jgi:hypothetical protein
VQGFGHKVEYDGVVDTKSKHHTKERQPEKPQAAVNFKEAGEVVLQWNTPEITLYSDLCNTFYQIGWKNALHIGWIWIMLRVVGGVF